METHDEFMEEVKETIRPRTLREKTKESLSENRKDTLSEEGAKK